MSEFQHEGNGLATLMNPPVLPRDKPRPQPDETGYYLRPPSPRPEAEN